MSHFSGPFKTLRFQLRPPAHPWIRDPDVTFPPRILSPKRLKIAMSHFSGLTDVGGGGLLSIEPRAARKFFFFFFFFFGELWLRFLCAAVFRCCCTSLSRGRPPAEGPPRTVARLGRDPGTPLALPRICTVCALHRLCALQSLCSRDAVEAVESVEGQQC